jgi:hypothetical protein
MSKNLDPHGFPQGGGKNMRKITANAYMTLDGRGVFPKYPGSDLVPK